MRVVLHDHALARVWVPLARTQGGEKDIIRRLRAVHERVLLDEPAESSELARATWFKYSVLDTMPSESVSILANTRANS